MRISPLAIWGSKLKVVDLEKVVIAELSLTHPNPAVLEAGITYCLAIQHLLANSGDMKGAFEKVSDYIQNKPKCTIASWLASVNSEELPLASVKSAWVKIAWCYAMYYLKKEERDYPKIIEEVLSKGGDTDTNACIVGAVIGAAIGLDKIPKDWIEKIKNVDVSQRGARCRRYSNYNPRNAFDVVPKLLKIRPEVLVIEDKEYSKWFP